MSSLKLASAQRRATLLHAAARVSKNVTSILDPDELLGRTVDIICDEFGFYYAGVFLLDEAGQWAVLRAGRGAAGAAMVAGGHKLAVGGNSMVGAATGRREARIALDVGEEAVFFKNPHLPETRSEMALPLAVGDEVIGALTVQGTKEAAFTASILDLDELLPMAVDIICDSYGFYYAGVFLLDACGQWAVLHAGRGKAGQAMIDAGHKLEVGGNSMIGAAIAQRQARIALDVGLEAVRFDNPFLPETRSEMALPLTCRGHVIGAMTVQSVQEAAFSDEDVAALQAMADHLAVAIHNAQLLRDLEQAHAELLRIATYEALATSTTEAIHWIGNKALPITTTVERLQTELAAGQVDAESLREDLGLIGESARLIVDVKEKLIGPALEQYPRSALLADVAQAAAFHVGVPADRLTIEVAPGTPMGVADTTQLARALGNLFQNALEANAEHITVTVAPAADDWHVAISVADDGDGIPAEMTDKIWAPFVTTKGPGHSGLGLPACLHIISQLEGRITVDNQPGQGATLTVLLPISFDELITPDLSPAPARILLIDDDDDWAGFVVDALTAAGKSVTRQATADGGADADLILVDEALVAMPVNDVLAALKEAGVVEKTIVVAAAMKVERTTCYLQAGVKDVVSKPYTLSELAALLASGL